MVDRGAFFLFPTGKMTRSPVTRQQIQSLANEGYYFRKKYSKSNTYITARKGKVELSLGLFTEDNWNYIRSLIENKESIGRSNHSQISGAKREDGWVNYQNEVNQLRENIQTYLGAYKVSHCLYVGDLWICRYWRIVDEPPYLHKLRELFGRGAMIKVREPDGSEYWAFQATGFMCRDCSAFIDERMVNFLKEHLDIKK